MSNSKHNFVNFCPQIPHKITTLLHHLFVKFIPSHHQVYHFLAYNTHHHLFAPQPMSPKTVLREHNRRRRVGQIPPHSNISGSNHHPSNVVFSGLLSHEENWYIPSTRNAELWVKRMKRIGTYPMLYENHPNYPFFLACKWFSSSRVIFRICSC